MKKIYKQILAAILFTAVILTLLVSCQTGNVTENNQKNTDDSIQAKPEQDEIQEAGEKQTTERIAPDLPDVNYNGYKFNILSAIDGEFHQDDFLAEDITGEIINDAKYARNMYVEEKYGVKLNLIILGEWSKGAAAIKKSTSSGDYAYDTAVVWGYDACTLLTQSLLRDLNSLPPLDLSKPWWDQKANQDLSIKEKMFFTTGDISQIMSDSIFAILFNKQLAQDYGIENPYSLVKSGKWTYDKFAELSRLVSGDLNGDGKYGEDDLYGMLATDDIMQCIINSVGEKCARINNSGEIELSLYNERTVSVFNKYMDFACDNTVVFSSQRVDDNAAIRVFEAGRGLFFPYGIKFVARFRSMETDFGILPFPKLDEQQNEYYSPIIVWWSMYHCVPVLQEDAERTAVILEALAAESRYTVRPAYYDISLKTKHSRDDESSEMLDIIFSTRSYDYGWYYKFGNYDVGILDLYRKYNKDFTSMYEKSLPKAEKDINKINDLFSQL